MVGEGDYQGYSDYSGVDINSKMKDIEEKQGILKDRLLLVGKNLIETREEDNKKMANLRKDIEVLKEDVEKIKNFIEMITSEMSKFARREDLEILSKQAKMFQPLEFVRKSELKKLRSK